MNIARFRDLSWFLSGVLKVVAILTVGTVLYGCFVYGTDGKQLFAQSFSSGVTWIGINTALQKVSSQSVYLANLFTWLLLAGMIFWSLWTASKIFVDFSNGETPFDRLQVDRLSKIAKGILWASVLKSVIFSLVLNILAGRFVTFRFELGSMFILGLILYCVAGMFRYGVQLQEISDDIV